MAVNIFVDASDNEQYPLEVVSLAGHTHAKVMFGSEPIRPLNSVLGSDVDGKVDTKEAAEVAFQAHAETGGNFADELEQSARRTASAS